MEKGELIIYDDNFFQEVTLNTLKGDKNLILYDTFVNNCKHPEKYKINRDDMAVLIKTGKLVIENMPFMYDKVPIRDKTICLALTKSINYDVIVYTNNGELALDLLLNGIKVKSEEYDADFVNIGKSQENDEIFIYDTCVLINDIHKIDFSNNYHYFSTCILEELLKKENQDKMFFMFLYILNKYPKHVKILNTVSSTQKGGRYSYTDLLLLYSTIRSKNEFKDKEITLVTKDRKLFYEAMYLNLFNVVSRFDYFDDVVENSNLNNEIEVKTNNIVEDTELAIPDEKEIISIDTTEIDEVVEEDEEKIFCVEVFKDDEEKIEEQTNSSLTSKISIKEKVIKGTKNHTEILLQKCNKMVILDKPEIVEQVYTSKFRLVVPIPKKKLTNSHSDKSYMIHPGYWITFKDNPKIYYRVMSVKKLKATLKKL